MKVCPTKVDFWLVLLLWGTIGMKEQPHEIF